MWLKVPIYSGVFPEIAHVDADLHLQLPQQLRTTVAALHDGVSRRRPEGSDMVEEQFELAGVAATGRPTGCEDPCT
jgi:hypothetical protein